MEPPDSTREEIERREDACLAPYALRGARAKRARRRDPEGRLFDYRGEYQRDRDRILHARAFRRLRLKSDCGALGRIDVRRDRLIHTLEVAQMARTIARALALNEDLAEAIALGHALGSPPFGRDGAHALDEPAAHNGREMEARFEPSRQALRVVDLLEKRYEHPGLNLTHDVREGIFKQGTSCCTPPPRAERFAAPAPVAPPPRSGRSGRGLAPGSPSSGILDGIDISDLAPGHPPFFETQAVAAADRIAAALGDLDDALRGSELDLSFVERLPIIRELMKKLGERYPASARGRRTMKANVIHRGLTHLLVTATIHHSRRTMRAWSRAAGIETHEGFLDARASLPPHAVEMGPRSLRLFDEMRATLGARIHAAPLSALAASRARRILHGLREAFHHNPLLLDDYVLLRFREVSGGPYLRDLAPAAVESDIVRRYHGSAVFLRLVTDHIAGMTDEYALSEYDRLLGATPSAGRGSPLP